MTDANKLYDKLWKAENDLRTLAESYNGQRQAGWFTRFADTMQEARNLIAEQASELGRPR